MNNINNDNTTLDIITSNIALINLLTSEPTLVEPEIALEISSEWLPNILNITLKLLNTNKNDIDDMANIAETVQKIGGIANAAATNLLNVSISDDDKNILIDNIQKIMRVELTGTWLGEIIVHIRDGSQTQGKIIPKQESCEFGSVSITIPPNNAATNSDTVQCIITKTDNNEVAIDLFDTFGTRVYQTNSSCFPYFISMNLPTEYGNITDAILDGKWYNTSNNIIYPVCEFWNSST
eukprot:113809_1